MATVTPTSRFQHIAAAVGHWVFVWGGWTKSMPLNESKECVLHDKKEHFSITVVDVLDMSTGTWKTCKTTGEPHKGIVGAACTVIGEYIFVFGGYCGHDSCFYNSITRLDTKNMTWEEFAPDCDEKNAPKKKRNCAMVLFNETILCIVGGEGPWPHSIAMDNADYSRRVRCASRENEVHCFDLNSGTWFAPSISGEPPPPCCHHTLINIHGTNKALLIGGFSKNGKFSDVYELTLSIDAKNCNWAQVRNDPHPKMSQRSGHTCTNVGKARALLIGGEDYIDHSLDEVWLLHCDTMGRMAWTKKEIELVEAGRAKRSYHTATVIEYNKQMWLIIVGGISEWMSSNKAREQKILSDTSILQLTFDEGNEVDIIPYNLKSYRQIVTSKNLHTGFEYKEIDVVRDVAVSSITLRTVSKSYVKQIWSDQFVFEENLVLVSEIFSISCTDDQKLVWIKLQHCAVVPEDDENSSENLRFVVCDDPAFAGPPYKFEALKAGYHFTESYFGEIKIVPTGKFLAICQKVECAYKYGTAKYTLDPCYGQRYFVAMYLNEENGYKTEACLAVCQYLEGKIEDMKNQLEQQGFKQLAAGEILTDPLQKSLHLTINKGNKTVLINGQVLVNGWKITPTHTNCQLDLIDVNHCTKFDPDEYPLRLSFEAAQSNTKPVTISLSGSKKKYSVSPKCAKHEPVCSTVCFVCLLFAIVFISPVLVSYYTWTSLDQDSNYAAVVFPAPAFASIHEVLDDEFIELISIPSLLCKCFHVQRNECDNLKREYAKGLTKEYVMDVVEAWHVQFNSLNKKDVYKALLCADKNAAKHFRQKHSKTKS